MRHWTTKYQMRFFIAVLQLSIILCYDTLKILKSGLDRGPIILKADGNRQFTTAYIEIPKKNGKQLSLDTPIPTPDGWSTMGELKIGDTVFDEKGKQCHVVARAM